MFKVSCLREDQPVQRSWERTNGERFGVAVTFFIDQVAMFNLVLTGQAPLSVVLSKIGG